MLSAVTAISSFAIAIIPLFILPLILQLQHNHSLQTIKIRWQEHVLLVMLLLIFLPIALMQLVFFPLPIIIVMLILIFVIVMVIVPMRLVVIVVPAGVFAIYIQSGRILLSSLPQGLFFLLVEYLLFVAVMVLQRFEAQPSTTLGWYRIITWFTIPLRTFLITWFIRPLRTFLVTIYRDVLYILFSVLFLYGQLLFSLFLDALAGYGYRPGRSLIAYILVIGGFALAYGIIAQNSGYPFSPVGDLVFSLISFHGRGFFPGVFPPSGNITIDNPLIVAAAIEAVIGLLIEISFIATFTQRFFGK